MFRVLGECYPDIKLKAGFCWMGDPTGNHAADPWGPWIMREPEGRRERIG